jgi:hypothetical protein
MSNSNPTDKGDTMQISLTGLVIYTTSDGARHERSGAHRLGGGGVLHIHDATYDNEPIVQAYAPGGWVSVYVDE